MTPEGKVVAYLVKRCRDLGFYQRKLAYEGRRGAPDRLILSPRGEIAVFVEVKAPGEKPRPEQVRELDLLRKSGLFAVVCDSKASVDELMNKLFIEAACRRVDRPRFLKEIGEEK